MIHIPYFSKRRQDESPVVPVKFIFWGNGSSERSSFFDYELLVQELKDERKINPPASLIYIKGSVDDIVRHEPTAVVLSLSHRNQVKTAKDLFRKRQCDIYLDHYIEDEARFVSIDEVDDLKRSKAVTDVLLSPFNSLLNRTYNKKRLEYMFRER